MYTGELSIRIRLEDNVTFAYSIYWPTARSSCPDGGERQSGRRVFERKSLRERSRSRRSDAGRIEREMSDSVRFARESKRTFDIGELGLERNDFNETFYPALKRRDRAGISGKCCRRIFAGPIGCQSRDSRARKIRVADEYWQFDI